jgi:serine/threonine protein kinase
MKIICDQCGKKYKDELKFCPECGTPVKEKSIKLKDLKQTDLDKTAKRKGKQTYGYTNLENLPEGFLIDERYEVKEKLGQGGYGAVYRVFDKKISIDKALKLIPYSVAEDREAYESLKSEAKTMIKLNHPNIARVYDFHEEDIKFIDMEFIDGKSVLDLKLDSPEKKLSEKEVKKLALQIAEGIAYAHNKNVIHKDIKPQNIIVTKENTIKILDFGIAETLRSSISRINNIATTGTLPYMPPEQILGENISIESDIYSFGITLYELLSGYPPFYRGDITYQVLNKKPKDIEGISPQMNAFVQKSIEKKQEDRFKSFDIVISILNNLNELSSGKDIKESHKFKQNNQQIIDKINEIISKHQKDFISNVDLLNKFKLEISKWANKIPSHNLKDLGKLINIQNIFFKPSYKVSLNTLYEHRYLTKEEKPYNEEQIPPFKIQEIEEVDIWSINIPFEKEFKHTSNALEIKGSQKIYNCNFCNEKGSITCKNCGGEGTIKCNKCKGFGKYTCTHCNGTGKNICDECNGTGHIICSYCDGSGKRKEFSGYDNSGNKQYKIVECSHCQNGYEICYSCNGVGKKVCKYCEGNGIVICKTCEGNGLIICKSCEGKGYIVCPKCNGKTKILKYIEIHSQIHPTKNKYDLFDNNLNKVFKEPKFEKQIIVSRGNVLIDYKCEHIDDVSINSDNFLLANLKRTIKKSNVEIPQAITGKNTKIILQHLLLTEIPVYEIYYIYEKKKYEMLIYNDIDMKINNYKIISINDPVLDIYKDHIKKSKIALKSKDYASALDNINKVILMYPSKSEPIKITNEIYISKAESLLNFNDLTQALNEINKAIIVDSRNMEQYGLKSRILRKIYLPFRIGIIAGFLLYQMIIGFSLLLQLRSMNDISTQNSLIIVSSPLIVLLLLMFLFIGNIFKTKIKTNKWRFYLGLICSGLVSVVAGYLFIIL